ncbi:hypothetical protein STVIR_4236 [Streptomyces viridochromogenes Tue57]|uniref:Uncharacterized protein n=1 Tax=Streptomyces viridochromogenes Tue57 TaxID=1160705 RepID=L8PEZ7_STRVR|nr:hypothetical protein STVIR_4236 [Streptomyces viridochromogenes Tue57]
MRAARAWASVSVGAAAGVRGAVALAAGESGDRTAEVAWSSPVTEQPDALSKVAAESVEAMTVRAGERGIASLLCWRQGHAQDRVRVPKAPPQEYDHQRAGPSG